MKATRLGLSKSLSMIIIISLVFSLLQFGFLRAHATPKFPFKNVIAGIQNISPTDNGSYTGDVPLNISVRFSARSDAPNSSLLPYQEITCIFQLDNGEWRNASLYSASEQRAWYDPTFQGYWNQLDCNYSAVLQGLSNGAHLLDIDLKPDLDYHYRISSNGTLVQKNLLDNATITFYVFGNYDKPVPTDQSMSPSPEIVLIVIIISTVIIVTGLGVLIHFKKRKRWKLVAYMFSILAFCVVLYTCCVCYASGAVVKERERKRKRKSRS